MAKFKRQMTEEELNDELLERGEIDEEGNLLEVSEEKEGDKKEDNIDWKKRHDDGRRFQLQLQARNKELEDKIAELDAKLTESVSVPANMDEFNEWVEQYPKVYEMVKIAARKEAAELDDGIKKRLTRLDELDKESKFREERSKLLELQPDFPSIAKTEEFQNWLKNEASDWAREALTTYDNPNAIVASDAIDLFKSKYGVGRKKESGKTTDEKEVASSTRTGSRTKPNTGPESKWSESKVAALSQREYEKFEEEIEEAIMSGTFVYDMRDAEA